MPATGRSDSEVARLLGISLSSFYTILTREKPISRSTAEMLGRLFHTGENFWLQMQAEYDRAIAPQIVVDAGPRNVDAQPRQALGRSISPMRHLPRVATAHQGTGLAKARDGMSRAAQPADSLVIEHEIDRVAS